MIEAWGEMSEEPPPNAISAHKGETDRCFVVFDF
jgi:hypothetical protein